MYNLSKLNSESCHFLTTITKQSGDLKELTNLAIAKAIANRVDIPTSRVQSPKACYIDTVMAQVRCIVSDLSDCITFDAQLVAEYVCVFWTARYSMAFPPLIVFTGVEDSESYFMGYGNIIAPKEISLMRNNSECLTNMLNAMTSILCQLHDDQPSENL